MPRPIRNEWPNGARIAVVLQLPLEVWGPGDRWGLSYLPRVPQERVDAGETDYLTESFKRFAGEVGIWRFIDVIDRYQVPAMGVFNGRAAQDYPDAAKAFIEGGPGREIAAHGWQQDIFSFELDRAGMVENVRKTASAIETVSGQRPAGWVSPGGQFNQDTIEILAEEGFLYHGDYAHSDTADVIDVGGRKLVRMAVPWEVNDYWQYNLSFNSPSAFVDMFRRSFDVLYREGGQIVGAALHAGIYGHAFGISALEECIEYALSKSEVWITNRRQIAELVLSQSS